MRVNQVRRCQERRLADDDERGLRQSCVPVIHTTIRLRSRRVPNRKVPAGRDEAQLDKLDPLTKNCLKRLGLLLEILARGELDHRPILAEPLEQPGRISNLDSAVRQFANLGAEVQDQANSRLGSKICRREIFAGAEARRIPLDPIGNRRIDREDGFTQDSYLGLLLMI